MPRQRIQCAVVRIHGLGDQKPTWSRRFHAAFRSALGADARRVHSEDAYWAPLSGPSDLLRPRFATAGVTTGIDAVEDELYRRVTTEFVRQIREELEALGARRYELRGRAFGPVDWLKDRLRGIEHLVTDVGNYVARNGVRLAVQHRLASTLFDVQRRFPDVPVVLVSHSQGTIISYDVLRLNGGQFPALKTWITMGSPLKRYVNFPLHWGSQRVGLPEKLRWVNLYDRQDIVGKELAGLLDWRSPTPIDIEVNNRRNAKDAHDHWHNPQVVKAVADEVRRVLD